MATQKLSNQRIHEVQQVLASYVPKLPGTDVNLLAALCKAVLTSVDLRDIRRVPSAELVEQLEQVLNTIKTRGRGEINSVVRRHDDSVVLESCLEDQPFLVSSLRALFGAERLEIASLMNAVIKVRRDSAGNLTSIGMGAPESVIRVELDPGQHVPEDIEDRFRTRLRIVQAMVRDFQPMKRRLQDLADDYLRAANSESNDRSLTLRETEGMVRWLCEENLVLLGVEEYDEQGQRISTLGTASVHTSERDADRFAAYARDLDRTVRYHRSNEESPVHRSGKPGHFVVTRVGRDGQPVGTCLINGLFTYKALHTPPEEIPFLRVMLRKLLTERSVSIDSHRGKSLTNAFNSLPLEYLLTQSEDSIWELTDRVLRAEVEGGSDVHINVGEDGRFVFAFVSLPREQFNDELRLQVQEKLQREFGATYSDFGVYMDRYDNAIIHYYMTGPTPFAAVDTERVRSEVLALAKGWNERLREALSELAPPEQVEELFELYHGAFSEEHKRRAGDQRLLGDLRCIENIRRGAEFDFDLYVSVTGDHPGSLNMRVFSRKAMNLSDELPLIGSFGFKVVDEYARPVHLAHTTPFELDNYRLDVRPERIPAVMSRADEIRATLRQVYAGTMGRDSLNQLIVSTTMTALEVEILRAYVAYLHQVRCPFTSALIRQTLVAYPTVASALVSWLDARYDPTSATPQLAEVTDKTLEAELRDVADYTADRVLRAVADVVRATLRTNAFVIKTPPGARRDQTPAMAFKFDGQRVPFGPDPKPLREIFIYHPDFEGVHLRGGRVARGGIRFSDRPDDFRTEIHGLMATQMVKNVLIVPVGAKGGFVLRQAPTDRNELRAAGDRYYQIFVEALLSVTDNVVDGQIVTPPGILHTEGPDPYLVVAADKGTAHLSDTANSVSMSHKFWLDDAFASGGSNGYDHKATGITARGAWETTKRNFREMGIDPEGDVITAIGVGDMSGDVFGNGLLRSRTVKLLAAFNHAHVFIDPTPDPEVSFLERERLFVLPRSQWSDYDSSKLSPGGAVFPRNAKSLDLSPEARQLLGFSPTQVVSGEEAIRAILLLKVDLCWMGGIGTYVKSKDETHADVGDKANDAVRVNANQLRFRVMSEGANLAITDRGRPAFARIGGQNYTSFLDNSGGVDTSDHEVNIKILFAPLLASGKVTRERRNEVLKAATTEVCDMVLANNRSQSRMVSYDVRRSKVDVYRYARTLSYLVQHVPFNPDTFALPTEDELANRARKGIGLFKCDASALCAYAKMLVYRVLLDGEPLSEGLVDRMVREYFPAAIVEAAEGAVKSHLLRREIATTMVVNRIVDNAGATFFPELMTSTGRPAHAIAEAYMTASAAGDVDALRRDLYASEDKNRQEAIYRAMHVVEAALEETTVVLLEGDAYATVDQRMIDRARELLDHVEHALPASQIPQLHARAHEFESAGFAPALAGRLARIEHLTGALSSLRVAAETGRDPLDVLRLRLQVAADMHLRALQDALSRMVYQSPWDGPAAKALSRQLHGHLGRLVQAVDGDDVSGMIGRLGLDGIRRQGAAMLEGGVTIPGIVLFDDHLRRQLPSADVRK
ncbi:NAD-glutamate dehydrogenase domain-containing protein [Nannocystis punicea]|uniref:NAD-glutamate dehydrogenase n=1 Tax=Nannocystis punicea TaxID=2995304 RepID=A0ABY7HHN6_9BACT|nr:NAD-glutamate dehydrogenase domain-containing protein [Nannocystis poenicansa]WAS98575.1 NAD-glutamate dehydrogenase [Nannocystis poenicansa]